MDSIQWILRENVLTDNVLFIAPENHVFKGGYIAYIKEWVFLNAWQDRQLPLKRFRSRERLLKYVKKNYKDFEFYDEL